MQRDLLCVPEAQNADDTLRLVEAMRHDIRIARPAPHAGARPQHRTVPRPHVQEFGEAHPCEADTLDGGRIVLRDGARHPARVAEQQGRED